MSNVKQRLEAVLNGGPGSGRHKGGVVGKAVEASKAAHDATSRVYGAGSQGKKAEQVMSMSEDAVKHAENDDGAAAGAIHEHLAKMHGSMEGADNKAASDAHWRAASAHAQVRNHEGCHCGGSCSKCKSSVANRLRNLLENSNPEGHNQYTNAGMSASSMASAASEKAEMASGIAREGNSDPGRIHSSHALGGSVDAVGAAKIGSHGDAEKRHVRAAEDHDSAANYHDVMSKELLADPSHENAASEHREAAKLHREAAGVHHDIALDKGQTQNDANFVSEQQRRFMWSKHPEIAEDWAHGEHSSEGDNHKMPSGPGADVKGPMADAARKRAAKRKARNTMNRKSSAAAALTCNALYVTANGSPADAAWEHEKAALAHLEATHVENVADAQAHAACRADHLRMAEQLRNGTLPGTPKRLWNIVANANPEGHNQYTKGGAGEASQDARRASHYSTIVAGDKGGKAEKLTHAAYAAAAKTKGLHDKAVESGKKSDFQALMKHHASVRDMHDKAAHATDSPELKEANFKAADAHNTAVQKHLGILNNAAKHGAKGQFTGGGGGGGQKSGFGAGDAPDSEDAFKAKKDERSAQMMAAMGAYNADCGGGGQAEDVRETGGGKVRASDYAAHTTNADDEECPRCGGEMEDGRCDECGYVENLALNADDGDPSTDSGASPPSPSSGGSAPAGGGDATSAVDTDTDTGGTDKTEGLSGASSMGSDTTLNANPEGHNQYSGGGGSAAKLSKVAFAASTKAHATTDSARTSADHETAARDSFAAARAHSEAGKAHAAEGNQDDAASHFAASRFHREDARTSLYSVKNTLNSEEDEEGIHFCPRDGSELEDGECPECGWSMAENAAPNQPRHSSGRYLPHGAGTGKGPVHAEAVTGFASLTKDQGSKTAGYPPAPGLKKTPYQSDSPEDASDELHEDDAHAQIFGRQVTPDGRNISDIRRPSRVVGDDDDAGHSDEDEPYDPISAVMAATRNSNPEGHNQYSKGEGSKSVNEDVATSLEEEHGGKTKDRVSSSHSLSLDSDPRKTLEAHGFKDKNAPQMRGGGNSTRTVYEHPSGAKAIHIEDHDTGNHSVRLVHNDRRNTPNEMQHCPKCGNQMLDGRCECGYTAPVQRGEGILPATTNAQRVRTLNHFYATQSTENAWSEAAREAAKAARAGKSAMAATTKAEAGGDHGAAADAHNKAASAHQARADSLHSQGRHDEAASHEVMSDLHRQSADEHRDTANKQATKAADDATTKAGGDVLGDKHADKATLSSANATIHADEGDSLKAAGHHSEAAQFHTKAAAEAKASGDKEGAKLHADAAKAHTKAMKSHLAPSSAASQGIKLNSRVFNMDPSACHDASKTAAKMTLDTEHPQAMEHSLAAVQHSGADEPDNAAAASSHMNAAKAHDKAAVKAYGDGNADGAASHEQAAAGHRRAAGMHKNVGGDDGAPTGNKKTTENKEDRRARREQIRNQRRQQRQVQQHQELVTNMNRQELIGYLVTNAGEVPSALEGLSDRALRALAASQVTTNAPGDFGRFDTPSGSFKSTYRQAGGDGGEDEYYERGVKTDHPVPIDGPNKGGNKDDDDDEDAPDDWDEDDIDSGGTNNSRGKSKTMTENEWMAQAPPAMREMAQEFKQHRTKQINNMIRRLVANERDPQRRQQLGNKWFQRAQTREGFQLLRETVGLLPTNNAAEGGLASIPALADVPLPNYLGAAGGIVENYTSNSDGSIGSDTLALPTINWAEQNKATLDKLEKARQAS